MYLGSRRLTDNQQTRRGTTTDNRARTKRKMRRTVRAGTNAAKQLFECFHAAMLTDFLHGCLPSEQ